MQVGVTSGFGASGHDRWCAPQDLDEFQLHAVEDSRFQTIGCGSGQVPGGRVHARCKCADPAGVRGHDIVRRIEQGPVQAEVACRGDVYAGRRGDDVSTGRWIVGDDVPGSHVSRGHGGHAVGDAIRDQGP